MTLRSSTLLAILVPVALAVLLFAAPVPQGGNDLARWATVWSLVHRGTYDIDTGAINEQHTVDKRPLEVGGERHFFSSKAAFYPTLVAGVYAGVAATGLVMQAPELPATRRVMAIVLVIVNLLPLAAALLLFGSHLETSELKPWTRRYALLTAGFGTLLTGYATTLNAHLPAALSLLVGLCFYTDFRTATGKPRQLVVSAAFLGLGVAIEPHVFPAASLMIPLLIWSAPRRLQWAGVAAFLLPLGAAFFCEWLATGHPVPYPVLFALGLKKSLYKGSYWSAPLGLDGNKDALLVRFFHMTLGHHGLFALTPALLVPVFYGFITALRKARRAQADLTTAATIGASVLFAALAYRTRNYGGSCQGYRWMFGMIPFWLFLLPQALETKPFAGRLGRTAAALALAVSVGSVLYCLPDPWGKSWWHLLLAKVAAAWPEAAFLQSSRL